MADAFEGDDGSPPLILTKKKKIPAEGHGGAWKIAYADFVTAMMAFFLLLWLLNATTEEQMYGISQYFAPTSVAEDETAVGEALKGLALAVDGAMRSASARPSVSVAVPTYGEEAKGKEAGVERKSEEEVHTNEAKAQQQQEEIELLNKAKEQLRQSIEELPDYKEIQDSLVIEMTPEGLLIQVLDQQKKPMFEPNSAKLTSDSRRLLALVGSIIATLPNKVSITGHTERNGFSKSHDFTNWELSGMRAIQTRQWLINAGLPAARVVEVEGRADTELLDPRNPESPRNRRISILLEIPKGDSSQGTDEAGK